MNIAIISGASGGIGLEFAKIIDSYEIIDELWLICGKNTPSYQFNKKVKLFLLDLSKENALEPIKNALCENEYCIKYLICSAGVGFNGNFENISEENILKTVSINCTSLTTLIKISLPYLYNGSKIINIASGAGFLPQPGFSVYASSKAYVISLSKALNKEFKSKNISVTAVCPGPVDTNFFSSLENVKEYKKKYLISPKEVAVKGLKASNRGKALCTPSFSMKLVHLTSKIVPTSIIMKFYK